jgi:DNA processing protein
MSQLAYQIALTLTPQVGAVTAKTLVSYCGSAEGVFRASRRELLKIPGIGAAIADSISSAQPLQLAEQELVFLEKHNIVALFYTDERYPARLKQNVDCPAMLYFKGSSTALLNARRIVAVVGTRQPTDYGRQMCEELIEGLNPYGVLIVSGLAYGIDIVAHRKSVALEVPNIGVLGHGLSILYPADHRATAARMVENGGLLTEFTHKAGPDRENFPMRNRIIAGMCDALLVVETAASGGSMISAELAAQYERDIFALPGRARDPKSAGCNLLIKNNRATLIESANDMVQALRWEPAGQARVIQPQLFPDLDPAETRIIGLIRQKPEIPIDQLTIGAGLPPGELASLLLGLEFKGVLRALPGKRYVLV